jgi:hypothetical protein
VLVPKRESLQQCHHRSRVAVVDRIRTWPGSGAIVTEGQERKLPAFRVARARVDGDTLVRDELHGQQIGAREGV